MAHSAFLSSFRRKTWFLGLLLGAMMAHAWATTPVVNVVSPANGSSEGSPVHFVATASSPGCAAGIAAMRIYPSPHNGAYTVAAASLDTSVALAAGSYSAVVQAWDNCGGVGKSTVQITIANAASPQAKFLYTTEYSAGKVAGFVVNPTTGALRGTGQPAVWAHWGPVRLAADKGGYRLYVVNQGSRDLNAYFINRSDGYLYPVPGSPVAIAGTGEGVAVNPSGRFVYAVSDTRKGGANAVSGFAVQADGSLKNVAGSPFGIPGGAIAVVIDPSGRFLYVSMDQGAVEGFKISAVDGSLTPIAGSPFAAPAPSTDFCYLCGTPYLADLAVDGGGRYLIAPDEENGSMVVFAINQSNGALSDVAGSPFIDEVPSSPTAPGTQPLTVAYNAETDQVFSSTNYFFGAGSQVSGAVTGWQLNTSNGSLTRISHVTNPDQSNMGRPTVCNQGMLRFDPAGKFLYGPGFDCSIGYYSGEAGLLGWGVDGAGLPSLLPGFPLDLGYVDNFPRNGIVVTP